MRCGMKKILLIIAILFIPWTVQGQMLQAVVSASGTGGGASCTLKETISDTSGGDQGAIFLLHTWYSGSFIPTSSYTMTQIGAAWKIQTGTPLYSAVTAYIYSDAAPGPGTMIATSTNTVSGALTGSYVYYTWQFAGVSLTNGTRYHLVVKEATFDWGYNEYLYWGKVEVGATTNDGTFQSDDGAAWTLQQESIIVAVKTYTGTCP